MAHQMKTLSYCCSLFIVYYLFFVSGCSPTTCKDDYLSNTKKDITVSIIYDSSISSSSGQYVDTGSIGNYIDAINSTFNSFQLRHEIVLDQLIDCQITVNGANSIDGTLNDYYANNCYKPNSDLIIIIPAYQFAVIDAKFKIYNSKDHIVGKNYILRDPMLFIHEFMHRGDLNHITQIEDNLRLNILSFCTIFFNYQINVNQANAAYSNNNNCSEILSVFQPTYPGLTYDDNCLTNLAMPLDEDVLDSLCIHCDNSSFMRIINQDSSTLDFKSQINYDVVRNLIEQEYNHFINDKSIISKEQYVQNKIDHFNFVHKVNAIRFLAKEVKDYNPEYNFEGIYTNEDSLNQMIQYILDEEILK